MHRCKLRISIALIFTITASPALADSVNGTFETKGKQFQPTDVAAFQAKDRTLVVLSTAALDRKSIASADDAYAAAINDPAVLGKDYITFWVNGKGVVSMNATIDGAQNIDSSGMIFGAQGGLVANCPMNAKERVTCHVTSVKDPRSKWTVDLAFDTAVVAQPRK